MYTSVCSVLQIPVCVVFCTKCEEDNVLIVVELKAHILLLECKVTLTVENFRF